jgi:hypothetical protein
MAKFYSPKNPNLFFEGMIVFSRGKIGAGLKMFGIYKPAQGI